jgi:hypothetical protein
LKTLRPFVRANVLDTCGGWKLERNIVTGHCRIISPERKRAAWGPEDQMRTSFRKIHTQLRQDGGFPSQGGFDILSGQGEKYGK